MREFCDPNSRPPARIALAKPRLTDTMETAPTLFHIVLGPRPPRDRRAAGALSALEALSDTAAAGLQNGWPAVTQSG